MPIDLPYIQAFLRRPGLEGPQQLTGYIPCDIIRGGVKVGTQNYRGGPIPEGLTVMGISGVTIATGVDLGQTDAATMMRQGLDQGIANMLRPYFGQRKDVAIKKLCALPLNVSREAADAMDAAILGIHAINIPARYNRDNPRNKFESLPRQAQAAIFSLLFQRGTGVAGKAPNTWAAFLRGDWPTAANLLCNGALWDGYQARRAIEGRELRTIRSAA